MGIARGYTRGDRPQRKRTTFRQQKRRFSKKSPGGWIHTGKAFARKFVSARALPAHRFAKRAVRAAPQISFLEALVVAAKHADEAHMIENFSGYGAGAPARKAAAIRRRAQGKKKAKKLTRGKTKTKRAGKR